MSVCKRTTQKPDSEGGVIMPRPKDDRIYALYHSDDYVCDGTISEIVAFTGKLRTTIQGYKSKSMKERSRYRLIELTMD